MIIKCFNPQLNNISKDNEHVSNSNNYLISVILPTYKSESFISDTIDSIIKQDIGFENIELIIIDDASPDNTKEILNDYANKYENIRLVLFKENSGRASVPRNEGIKLANADYIMFIDHDDYYTPDCCSKLYEYITQHNADVVSSRYYVDNTNSFNNCFLQDYTADLISMNSISEHPEIIYSISNMTIWNKIYNKQFLIDNNIDFVEIIPEDYLFCLKCFIYSKKSIVLPHEAYYIHNTFNEDRGSYKPWNLDTVSQFMECYNISKELIKEYDLDYQKVLSELIVQTSRSFVENGYSKDNEDEILNILNPCFKEYPLNAKLINNISLPLNITLNIFIKLSSITNMIPKVTKKVYNILF